MLSLFHADVRSRLFSNGALTRPFGNFQALFLIVSVLRTVALKLADGSVAADRVTVTEMVFLFGDVAGVARNHVVRQLFVAKRDSPPVLTDQDLLAFVVLLTVVKTSVIGRLCEHTSGTLCNGTVGQNAVGSFTVGVTHFEVHLRAVAAVAGDVVRLIWEEL